MIMFNWNIKIVSGDTLIYIYIDLVTKKFHSGICVGQTKKFDYNGAFNQ